MISGRTSTGGVIRGDPVAVARAAARVSSAGRGCAPTPGREEKRDPGGPADLLAEPLLLGPQPVRARDGRPAPLVGGQQGVHHVLVLAAGTLRRAHGIRVLAERPEVNHRYRLDGPDQGRTICLLS